MTTYSLDFMSLDSGCTEIPGLVSLDPTGAQWDCHAPSRPGLSLVDQPVVHRAVVEDGLAPGVDPAAQDARLLAPPHLDQDITDASGQILWPAGASVRDAYVAVLSNAEGMTFRLVAIAIDGQIAGFTFDGAMPLSGQRLGYAPGQCHDFAGPAPSEGSLCFAADTLIATARGDRRACDLLPGDMILTRDAGFQQLRWRGVRTLAAQDLRRFPHLRPVRIAAGALGPATPRTTLRVAPRHRVMLRSHIASRMFGKPEIMVAARHLAALPGIEIDREASRISYAHLLFDRHPVIYCNGAPTDSLFSGSDALRILPASQGSCAMPETDLAGLVISGAQHRKVAE